MTLTEWLKVMDPIGAVMDVGATDFVTVRSKHA